jgi:hypothetical protein
MLPSTSPRVAATRWLAFVKYVLVAREFMMLRGVRLGRQAAVIAWLAVVLTAILCCFWRA